MYEDLRRLLFSIAYGIVGSISEAEDIVQEAFLRFNRRGRHRGAHRPAAADVVAYTDGGGRTQTFTRPVYGRERIARLLPGFEAWLKLLGAEEMRLAEVNGQPGAVFVGPDGRAVLVVSLDIAEGSVQTIRAVTNPEKLGHLGPNAAGPRAACSLSAAWSPSSPDGRTLSVMWPEAARAVTRDGPVSS